MLEISLTGVAMASLAALQNWQRGIFLAVVVAFLQDPLRKLVVGQPAYFILFTGVVFGAAMLGALIAKVPLWPSMVVGWRRFIGPPFQIFVLIVVLQAVHSLLRFGNPMVSMLGIISYLMPFAALALAHAFAATGGSRRVHALLLLYAVLAILALLTIYLEATGINLAIFGEVGGGILLYDKTVGLLTAHSGIFRASEIAAWHAAACSCVIVILMTYRKLDVPRIVLAAAIVCTLVALGMLTGRRKFVVMIAIFGAAYIGLMGVYLQRVRSIAIPAVVVGVVAYFLIGFQSEPDVEVVVRNTQAYDAYVRRTTGVFGDIQARFEELGLAPIMWAYNEFGLLGGGAGIGTQGVQKITEVGGNVGAAEGGLGKIMVELGLPGLLAAVALGLAFGRHIWRLLQEVAKQSQRHFRLASGLVALLIANVASFSIATQAFGDVFILMFLGISLGTLLAIPRIVAREVLPPSIRPAASNAALRAHPRARAIIR